MFGIQLANAMFQLLDEPMIFDAAMACLWEENWDMACLWEENWDAPVTNVFSRLECGVFSLQYDYHETRPILRYPRYYDRRVVHLRVRCSQRIGRVHERTTYKRDEKEI